uniref:F-box domain-containing protein n=1 Tax=Oryza glumipatula TaxID=40148 RepID=A0A0D9ZBD1_9ORYZ
MASERAGSKRAAKGTEGTTAAAALQLHGDVLGEVLRRLAPRWLAACRCVCKAWRDAIDDGGLLRADLLPLSIAGFFLNFSCHDYSEYFSRPTTTTTTTTCHRHLITGKLDFLPSEGEWQMALDHCNGLLLLESGCVVNPATKAWMDLTPYPPPPPLIEEEQEEVKTYPEEHLVFDPTLSPHFEVLIIPHLLPFDKDRSKKQPPQNSAWPPSPLVLNVFSSRTREWEERPFVREGEAAGAMADVASGVYFASLSKDRLLVWLLDEPCGDMKWVLMHQTDLGPSLATSHKLDGHWILHDINYECSTWLFPKGRKPLTLVRENFEWNSDDDDVVNDAAEDTVKRRYDEYALILGFHPYKEILFIESMDRGYAYHLSSSKFEELGKLRPVSLHGLPNERLDVELSFPYTPCWIEEFPQPELDCKLNSIWKP